MRFDISLSVGGNQFLTTSANRLYHFIFTTVFFGPATLGSVQQMCWKARYLVDRMSSKKKILFWRLTLTSFYNDRNTKNNRVYGHPAKFCVGKQKSHFLRFLRKISHFCSLIGYGGVGVNQRIKRAGKNRWGRLQTAILSVGFVYL